MLFPTSAGTKNGLADGWAVRTCVTEALAQVDNPDGFE